jgi:hypothetical protein
VHPPHIRHDPWRQGQPNLPWKMMVIAFPFILR